MGKVEKITIKLAMLFIGLSLLFPARVLAAEKNEINEITEKKQIIFLLDASKSMQGDGQWIEAADSACMIASALPKEYEVALLVYNTEIVYEEDFGNINQKTRPPQRWRWKRRLICLTVRRQIKEWYLFPTGKFLCGIKAKQKLQSGSLKIWWIRLQNRE